MKLKLLIVLLLISFSSPMQLSRMSTYSRKARSKVSAKGNSENTKNLIRKYYLSKFDFYEDCQPVLDYPIDNIFGEFKAHVNKIKNTFLSIWNGIKNFFSHLFNSIGNAFSRVKTFFSQFANKKTLSADDENAINEIIEKEVIPQVNVKDEIYTFEQKANSEEAKELSNVSNESTEIITENPSISEFIKLTLHCAYIDLHTIHIKTNKSKTRKRDKFDYLVTSGLKLAIGSLGHILGKILAFILVPIILFLLPLILVILGIAALVGIGSMIALAVSRK
jgi:hypothetical protein